MNAIHTGHAGNIIRCSAGLTYRVTDSTTYDHAFIAVPVRRVKDGWADKQGAKAQLIRRALTASIAAEG